MIGFITSETDLLHDSLFIVVAQRSAEFIVVHRRSILLDPPPTRHLCQTHRLSKKGVFNIFIKSETNKKI